MWHFQLTHHDLWDYDPPAAPILANMKPEARSLVKLLKFDPSHPTSKLPLTIYAPATLRASSYPNLVSEDFTTIAVGAFLVTYDFNLQTTVDHLVRFARSLCQNFSAVQANGHPKWREVDLALPKLNPGWTYYGPTEKVLRSCVAQRSKPRVPAKACSAEERILGFCK